jgi:hypothetical protein
MLLIQVKKKTHSQSMLDLQIRSQFVRLNVPFPKMKRFNQFKASTILRTTERKMMGQYADRLELLSDTGMTKIERPDLGPFSFVDLHVSLEALKWIIAAIDETPPHFIPNETRNATNSTIGQIFDLFNKIEAFTAARPEAFQERQNIITNGVAYVDQLLKIASPYAVKRSIEESELVVQLQLMVSSLTEEKQKLELTIREISSAWPKVKAEWEDLQSQERLTFTSAGTSEASAFFENRSTAHQKISNKFGIWAILLSVLLIVWLLLTGQSPLGLKWNQEQIVLSIIRGIPHFTILTLVTFAIGICVRNYRINQHLAVLNKTKATTLSSGESFVKSIADVSTRDIVLETIVRSVFTIGDTGFLNGEQERTVVESPNLSALVHMMGSSANSK